MRYRSGDRCRGIDARGQVMGDRCRGQVPGGTGSGEACGGQVWGGVQVREEGHSAWGP